jgi:EmrB/QacA subfamily drug resistance transporter
MAFVPSEPENTKRTSRGLALAVLCTGMLMIVLDSTIVNVALPAIQSELGFDQSNLAWVVNAYLIAFGGVLLLMGRIGDLVGRTRVFLAGLALFTGASLACGIAPTQEALIAARFIQGVGGAMTSSVVLGMIVTLFPEPGERTRAIGMYSFVASAGASIGLLAGGVISQSLGWHWIFIVNVPIGIATGIAAWRLLEHDRGIGFGQGADVPGAALITAALTIGVYAIVGADQLGWASTQTLALILASLVLLGAFLVRESRTSNPLLPLRIFRSRHVSGANAIQLVVTAAMFGIFFLTSIYLERVLGFDAFLVGIGFLPISLSIGALSLGTSASLITRFGARSVLVPGLGLMAGGLLLLSVMPPAATYLVNILPSLLLFGLGAGLTFPAVVTVAMSDSSARDSGLASGLVNTSRQVGGSLGLAMLASVSASRAGDLLANGSSPAAALTGGIHVAYAAGLLLIVGAISIAVLVLRGQPRAATAEDEVRLGRHATRAVDVS